MFFVCRYTIKYSLKRHLLYDHSDPKFECGKCRMKFRYNFQRVNHMKVHHKRRRWSHSITILFFISFVRTVDWLAEILNKKKTEKSSNTVCLNIASLFTKWSLEFWFCWIKIWSFAIKFLRLLNFKSVLYLNLNCIIFKNVDWTFFTNE